VQNEGLSAGTLIRVGPARPRVAGEGKTMTPVASTSTRPTAVFGRMVTSQSPKFEMTTGEAISGRISCTPLANVALCIVINRVAPKT